MIQRRLVFLGGEGRSRPLQLDGADLAPGAVLNLQRRRSPWGGRGDLVRVILGSHPDRADLLLRGEGIRPEHFRVYFRPEVAGSTEARPLLECPGHLNGRELEPLEWARLQTGDELSVGSWRFRYEELEDRGS